MPVDEKDINRPEPPQDDGSEDRSQVGAPFIGFPFTFPSEPEEDEQ